MWLYSLMRLHLLIAACVDAINAFREEHGLVNLVV
jgi:hypothetical protein